MGCAASNAPGPDHVQATMDASSGPTDSHPHIVIQRPDDSELYRISQTGTVKDGPRPYLVMCTVHWVVFKSEAQLKAFLRAQEEWHKEIVCSVDAKDTAPDGTPDALTKKRDLVIPQNVLLVRPVRVVDSESTSKLSSIFPWLLDLVAAKFGTVRGSIQLHGII
ncbi:unnamed protein product [Echinostoma caproni]|uniref:Thioredoxin-like_fold domain-containing protein n=1 Tax=Echinostoma caproni TaxID=27848 RepID=A0A183AXJ4_9TREM|nr:unnamed protein product [Echinostoma caproni]